MTGAARDIGALRARHDESDMLGRVIALPSQMEDAWEIGEAFSARIRRGDYTMVAVCGMGGSAIGGDMVRSFLGDRLKVPLVSCRDYAVPAYVGRGALVIASSYSGNTGETLSAYRSVRGRVAGLVAVTGGGKLEEMCREDGVPLCKIPGGMPPRAAIGYSFFPMLQIVRAAGVADFDDSEYAEGLDAAKELAGRYGPDFPDNRALELAKMIEGKIPFVYAAPGLFEAMARRWVCQFNENSKTLAHFALSPELNHNEIVGWQNLGDVLERVIVISLEDREDHDMTRHQTEIGLGIRGRLAAHVERVDGGDGGRMKRMIAALMLGDFTSVYLALLYGVDPTPVEKIDYLKRQLSAVGARRAAKDGTS